MTEKITKEKVGAYRFAVMPFHCDFSNHLRLDHLGNDMLNAADFHSDERRFGMNYLNTIGKTWVLSRLAIEVIEMPVSYRTMMIETWVKSAMRFFTHRNFAVSDADNGSVYAYGRSVWAMIDTANRQPTDLFAVNDGLILDYVEDEKACPIDACSRVKVGEDTQLWKSFPAEFSDIDINGHVNSVKYIEHLLNLWDIDWYRHHFLKRIELAYVAETYHGEQMHFSVETISELEYNIKISTDKHEVCRCSIKYLPRF